MVTPVKQSASKEDFVKALKLNMEDKEQKERFSQMWDEVTRYWEQHFETEARHILRPEYASNAAVKRPYKWAHLSENAVDQAIAAIRAQAKPAPRHYYDLGQSSNAKVNNWVLKWLLWHVCRYRDWRNRKHRHAGRSSTDAGSSAQAAGGGASGPSAGQGGGGSASLNPDGYPSLPPHDYWATVLNRQ